MNIYPVIFLAVTAPALLLVSRSKASLLLLIGACLIPCEAFQIKIGELHFTAIRLLISIGLLRIIIRGERLSTGKNRMDLLMVAWAFWAATSSIFHVDPEGMLINRLGIVLDTCGVYLLFRVFCQSLDDVVRLGRYLAILLVFVAIEMIYEKTADRNIFFELVGKDLGLYIRHGHIRAQGPFAHSILAGTIGAACIPLIVTQWLADRKIAVIGIGACLFMIITCSSSGPILSAMVAMGTLYMYRHPEWMRRFCWLAVAGYFALAFIMNDPPYFIMARIDIAGGSTGWHRAELIKSAIAHLSEWWLYGTDYTRHWMPTGVPWSQHHTDITNHYIKMGVWGGLPLMFLFMAILAVGFAFVVKTLQQIPESSQRSQFIVWALGAALFTHAVSFIGVSYFDQSFVFLNLTLAAISSVYSGLIHEKDAILSEQ